MFMVVKRFAALLCFVLVFSCAFLGATNPTVLAATGKNKL